MLKCKEATHLMSEAQDRKLSFAERAGLTMHLALCNGCRNFRRQMGFLREICRRYVSGRGGPDGS